MTCEDFPLLPTPSAQFHEQDPETFLARREREKAKHRNGNGFGLTLGMAVSLLPPSAPVSADSTSPSTGPSEPSQPSCANQTPTAAPCSSATGPESPCCPTCGKSTPDTGLLTCCTPATPANRSHRQDAGSGPTTPAISGPPSHEPFAFYDPSSSSWRTSQATLLSDSTACSVSLPKWGCLHGGALYELPTWEPPTDAQGCLSLLGTPSVADAMGGHLSRGGARSHELLLKGQVKALLPTPTTDDASNTTRDSGEFQSLVREVHNLLPTPMSATYEQGGDAAGSRGHRRDGTPYGPTSGVTLTDALKTFSGASTSPPSDGGNTRSDEPPQDQLTIEDA